MIGMRIAAMSVAVAAFCGCAAGSDDGSDVSAQTSALTLTTVGDFIYMPPRQSLRDAMATRAERGGLIPDDCKAFQTLVRVGSTLGSFRAYGVCVRPYDRIVFQIEGEIGGSVAATTGASSVSEYAQLQAVLGIEASKNSNEPDFWTGGGGLFPKGGPPQPGGTDPRVILGVAHDLQDSHEMAERALSEATLPR